MRRAPVLREAQMRASQRPAAPSLFSAGRPSVKVCAERGRAILPSSIKVDRIMGEGSFGQVFQGSFVTPSGEEKVVLKRVKAKVEGAAQMGQMELLLNAYAAKVARNHCADFMGYCEVAEEEATARLTPGLWLMWKFEGSRTLSYYLRRRDTLRALASDLEVPEEAVVATVMKQLFEGLAAFHAAGLVHRDVKPLNVIFAEQQKRFKLIDLGACADLRSGINYVPSESILDPLFCAPEQYVLPTDSPDLSKSFLKIAISPVLWAQHKPDRFDMWSAGVSMLQLAVPAMRQDRVLKRFNQDFGAKYNYDLDAWRVGSYISNRDFEVLDADDGAGWELAKALLRPRSIRVLEDNSVVFVNDNSAQRISAGEALRHRFMKQAREPGCIMEEDYVSSTSGGSRGGSRANGSTSGSGGPRRGQQQQQPASGGANGRAGSGNLRGAAAALASSAGSASNGKQRRSGGGGTASGDEQQAAPGAGRAGNAGTFGAAVGLWRNLTNKLFDLEANIMVTASMTEKQSTVVRKLQQKAAQGQVPKEAVQKEVRKLSAMEQQLTQLQDDFNSTANAVGNVLGFLGFGPTKSAPATPPPAGRQPSGSKQQQGSAGSKASSGSTSSGGGTGGGGLFGGFSFGQSSSSRSGSVSAQESAAPAIGSSSRSADGGGGGGMGSLLASAPAGIWAAVQSKLSDLEFKFNNQIAATERQSFTVKKLRQGVRTGQVDASTLQKAEAVLQRMERRVNELDQDLKKTRQEATGLLGVLASSVSQVTGGSGSTSTSSSDTGSGKQRATGSSSTASPPPSPQKQPSMAPSSSNTGGGMGNFFNRMFGGSQPPASSTSPAPQPARGASSTPLTFASPAPLTGSNKQQQQRQAPQPSQAKQPPSSFSVASSASLDQEEPGSGNVSDGTAAVIATGSAITEGASSIIANSLKFTGMAAKVALGMAAGLKADAEKVLKEMEAEAAAKRARKMAEQAFLRMLATKVPPMAAGTTFAEVEAFFGQDARYLAVEAAQRPLLVASYVDALVQAQVRSAQQAQAKLRELLSLSLKLDSTWEEACAQFGDNPVFLAVEDPAARRAVYDEVVAALAMAEDTRLAVGLAEQAFMDLLQEVTPPISPDSSWPRVKPLLWRDYRYLALPEARRKALFDEMHAVVCEQAKQEAETRAAKGDKEATSVAELVAASTAAPDPAAATTAATASSSAAADVAPAAAPVAPVSAAAPVAAAAQPAPAAAAPAAPVAAAAQAAGQAAAAGDGQAPVNPSLLEDLRKQQARLRAEYEAMERKLREMEAALTTRETQNQLLAQPSPPPPSASGTTPALSRSRSNGSTATPHAARGGANGAATPAWPGANGASDGGAAAASAVVSTPAAQPGHTVPSGPSPITGASVASRAAAAAGGATPRPQAVGTTPSGARIVTGSGVRRSIIATPPIQRASGGGAGGPSSTGASRQQDRMQAEQERVVADSLASAGVSYKRLKDGTLVFTFEPEDGEELVDADLADVSAAAAAAAGPAEAPAAAQQQQQEREPSRSRTPA